MHLFLENTFKGIEGILDSFRKLECISCIFTERLWMMNIVKEVSSLIVILENVF